VLTDAAGEIEIEVPRDREGTFDPVIVKKRQRRLSDADEVVLSLYAKGLTTGEISAHFADVYGASVSKDTVSRITERVIEEMQAWSARPLEAVYAAVFIDAFLHTPPGKQMVDLLPTLSPEVHRILEHEAPASQYSTISAEVLLTYGSRSSQYFKDISHTLATTLPHARALAIPRASHNTANIAPVRLTDPLLGFFTGARARRGLNAVTVVWDSGGTFRPSPCRHPSARHRGIWGCAASPERLVAAGGR
jgi:Transposase, Mutator family